MYESMILWTQYLHSLLRKLTLRKAAYLFFLLQIRSLAPTSLLAVGKGPDWVYFVNQ